MASTPYGLKRIDKILDVRYTTCVLVGLVLSFCSDNSTAEGFRVCCFFTIYGTITLTNLDFRLK